MIESSFYYILALTTLGLPLLSFLVNALALGKRTDRLPAWFSLGCAGGSLLSAITLAALWLRSAPTAARIPLTLFDWLWFAPSPMLELRLGFELNALSVMMLVVVTVIAFLVQTYSVGYMKGDPSYARFFSLLSLFAFAMLGLVTSSNLLQMYVFWELVGVSSYSLIGFWYHKPSASAAAQKAFLLTRFADSFFLLGIVILATTLGTFDFDILNQKATAGMLNHSISLGFFSVNALGLSTVLIFIGGWGKSALFPLHVWLPDAMEGPTPVSAIIHSATMVVAGIFLTARLLPLFAAAETPLVLARWAGGITAALAALIACTQTDIKRILAFSTLSQLGYMMFALGCTLPAHGGEPLGEAYGAALFHVFTHAFFKCLLFLGAGSIIHAVHSNEITAMGGLRRHLPWTYTTVLIACIAIAGIFPLAGFWSKDAILIAAWNAGHRELTVLGLLTGGLTAFYMFRFFLRIFHGSPAQSIHAHAPAHSHENPWMIAPMVALTLPTVLAGIFLHSEFAALPFPSPLEPTPAHHPHALPWVASGLGVLGIALAWLKYGRAAVVNAPQQRPFWYRALHRKLWFDEVYGFVIGNLLLTQGTSLLRHADRKIVDGSMNAVGLICLQGGKIVRWTQNGHTPLYLAITFAGLLLLWLAGTFPF